MKPGNATASSPCGASSPGGVGRPATWNVPQTLTVTGVDDLVDDGDLVRNVTLVVDDDATADTTYDGIADDPDRRTLSGL